MKLSGWSWKESGIKNRTKKDRYSSAAGNPNGLTQNVGALTSTFQKADYIIQSKPSVTGIEEKVYDNSMIIYCEQMYGHSYGTNCPVNLLDAAW